MTTTRRTGPAVLALIAVALVAPVTLAAQEAASKGWDLAADLGLALTQSGYSDSWQGGESGSISWSATANMTAGRVLNPSVTWANDLKLAYGQSHLQDSETKDWAPPKKSTDRIFLESLLKYTLGWSVDPYTALTVESQFYDASVPEKARYLTPTTLTESVGIGRSLIATEQRELYSRLGVAFRQKLTNAAIAPATAGGDWGTEWDTVTDGGFEWVTDYKHTFAEERMNLVTKLRLFQALVNSESDALAGLENEDYWQAPDVAWEATFSAAVSKYIQVTLFAELLYDKEVELRGRFRETLGLGLSYKLF
ncbi:MAG: DUF3078 domain-containing protein [Candidatus Krumholzibacteriota bacterium]|nr:DUF3078 domain-containing protein [Candidatus Krumholzibacteriota bacterium]